MAFDATVQIIVISRIYYKKESKTLEPFAMGRKGGDLALKLLILGRGGSRVVSVVSGNY